MNLTKEEMIKEAQEIRYNINILQDRLNRLETVEIEKPNPFNVKEGDTAYYVNCLKVNKTNEWHIDCEDYYTPCKDRLIMYELMNSFRLNILLKKFAYDNDAVVTPEMWEDTDLHKYAVIFNNNFAEYAVGDYRWTQNVNVIYFTSEEVAERAIKEVVLPFMDKE